MNADKKSLLSAFIGVHLRLIIPQKPDVDFDEMYPGEILAGGSSRSQWGGA
jgi:hypothetical protein